MSLQGGGSHSTGLGRFSGAFYHDASGFTIPAGAAFTMPTAGISPYLANEGYYDTDSYLQGGVLVAPFAGYYRLTGSAFSDQTIQDDFMLNVQGDGTAFALAGKGTATDGISVTIAQTFFMSVGQAIQTVFINHSVSDQLIYLSLQVEYLGPP